MPDPAPSAMAKSIRWWDGVALTLSLPAALFVSLGYRRAFREFIERA